MNENASQSASSEATEQIIYEFARAAFFEGWWAWALLVFAIGSAVLLCLWFYRRDVDELPQGVRWTLLTARLVLVLGLVFFFFNLQRRTQRLVTRPSELVVLVDTSQSMSLPTSSSTSSPSRTEAAAQLLGSTDLLQEFGQQHRTSVYAFDAQSEPRLIETRGGLGADENEKAETVAETGSGPESAAASGPEFSPPNPLAMFGVACLATAAALAIVSLLMGVLGRGGAVGWVLFAAVSCMIFGTLFLGGVYAVRTERSLAAILGIESLLGVDPSAPLEQESDATDAAEEAPSIRVTDWSDQIAANGAESRIGDAVRTILTDHDPATLAGIVLVTDGQNNGGSEPGNAVNLARRNAVSLYPVGMGSSDPPLNVRVVDIDAPKRVYPGDRFPVSAVLQASGPSPVTVDVQLIDGLADDGDSGEADTAAVEQNAAANVTPSVGGTVIDSKQVRIDNDGTLAGVRFEVEPESVGRRQLAVRIVSPAEDRNRRDDVRSARYEVVARKLKVLAIAGGPTREYRFVRNLLFRDNSIQLDVWLQTGQPGMSQDADALLDAFPATAEQLFDYDAIIMFDPDWLAIGAESLELLDRWLTQQAGGLVLVAGPVFHPEWTRLKTDPRVSKIAGFFPVNLATRGPLLGGGRQGGEAAWPLDFTAEAGRAEFLWIADTPEASSEVWESFSGVYDFVGIKGPKAGAKVYARFSDPTAEVNGALPVYLASQFYGAGRVFFQASGEMWRLRGESDAYFDQYYTKLVRWVSEGRLLRDSKRGILLVDTARAMIGDTISVRAVLTDEQFEPLDVPEVPAKLLMPGGEVDDVVLLPLQGEPRPGTYGGRFVVREAGSYEIRLTLGDALNEQVLRQSVQVRLPTVELERPRRNDEQLQQFAAATKGVYLPVSASDDGASFDVSSAIGQTAARLLTAIEPQPQTTVLPGTFDREFTQRRNAVLMWLLASVLTFEWITRRLHRLA